MGVGGGEVEGRGVNSRGVGAAFTKMQRRPGEGGKFKKKKILGPTQRLLAYVISPWHKVAVAILQRDVNGAAKTSIHFGTLSMKKHFTWKALHAVPFLPYGDRGIGLLIIRHH